MGTGALLEPDSIIAYFESHVCQQYADQGQKSLLHLKEFLVSDCSCEGKLRILGGVGRISTNRHQRDSARTFDQY